MLDKKFNILGSFFCHNNIIIQALLRYPIVLARTKPKSKLKIEITPVISKQKPWKKYKNRTNCKSYYSKKSLSMIFI